MGSGATRAVLAAVLCAVAAAVVYALAFHTGAGREFDLRLLEANGAFITSSAHPRAGQAVEFLNLRPYTIAVAIVLAIAGVTGGLRAMAAVVLICAGANATTQLLQAVTETPRPIGWLPDSRWPSGHVTAASALAVSVVLATPAFARPLMAALSALGLLATAFSVLLISSHVASDVLGAILVAGAWTGLAGAGLMARALRGQPPGRRSVAGPAIGAALGCAALGVAVASAAPLGRFLADHGTFWAGSLLVAALGAGLIVAATMLPAPRRAGRAAR